jgi:hypothetical protein
LRSIASYLVDDAGGIHLGCAGERSLPDDVGCDEITAVKEDGRIEWLAREGHVRVRFRPSLVSAAARARLMAWLACSRPERVLLSWYAAGEWHYEFLRNPVLTGERVSSLIEQHGGAGPFNLRRRPCSLTGFPSKPTHDALAFWREHRDSFQGRESMRVLGPLLQDRWILYRALPGFGFAAECFGRHHAGHVTRWLAREGQLDRGDDSFPAHACAVVYGDVVKRFAPGCDELDAISWWTGYGRRRSQYRRLMLPFRSGHCAWVVSGVRLDPAIDLLD